MLMGYFVKRGCVQCGVIISKWEPKEFLYISSFVPSGLLTLVALIHIGWNPSLICIDY